ncbi:MAG: response regulator transcription factor [Candidatus Limimorpha sp.]
MNADNKIIIVDPSPILVCGLTSFLEEFSQLSVISQLDNIDRLEEKILIYNPNILIINPLLTANSDILNKIQSNFSDLKVFAFVSSYIEKEMLKKFDEVIEMNDSKQKVANKIFNILKSSTLASPQNESIELTNREIEVLIALVKGLTNKEISEKLFISIHTVITHRKNIIKKTGIKSVSGLTVYALINNIIDDFEIR